MVPVQTGSETVSGNMGMPRPGTKRSGVFGKIPDRDRDRGVWSGSDRVPIGLGPNFPNTNANRSAHFMDAYKKGLNGAQAVWANRKYHGHRVLPENILTKLDAPQKK